MSLMASYQAGSADCFEALYRKLAPALGRFLHSLCHDAETTRDLLQETFLQLHRARHTYDPRLRVEPWAYAIARNVFLADRRRNARARVSPKEEPEAAVGPHEELIVARDWLNRALGLLTPKTRDALLLHHLWGLSFAEIGAQLGIQAELAKLRSSRGIARLKKVASS